MVCLARVLFQVHRQQLHGKRVFQECYQHQCADTDRCLHVYLDIKKLGAV